MWLPKEIRGDIKLAISTHGYAVVQAPVSKINPGLERLLLSELDSFTVCGTENIEVIPDWDREANGVHTKDPDGRKRKQVSLELLPSGGACFLPYFRKLASVTAHR